MFVPVPALQTVEKQRVLRQRVYELLDLVGKIGQRSGTHAKEPLQRHVI
jgi:hypothetical protein